MADDFAISSVQRSTISSLQNTTRLQGRNQQELATGRVNPRTAVIADLVSRSLSDRASDISTARSNLADGQATIQAAEDGLSAIEESLDLAYAIAEEYERTTDTDRQAELQAQFDEVAAQIDFLAEDASYNGVNLISSSPDTPTLSFGAGSDGSITLNGQASDSTGLNLTLSTESVAAAREQVRATQEDLGVQQSALEIRDNFSEQLANTLETGAAELVETDLNEDAVEALALDTRRQLGTASLSITSQSERSILSLF